MSTSISNELFQPFFTCSCGTPIPVIDSLSEWTRIVAFDCAHWIDWVDANNAARIDHRYTGNLVAERQKQFPAVDSLNFLMVDNHFGMPKAGGSVWVVFKPPYSTENDWDVDMPDEFFLSGLARVEVVEILSKYQDNAWLKVRVLEVLRITDLIDQWSPKEPDTLLPDLLNCGPVTCQLFGDFAYCTASADDSRQSILCQQRKGRWIMWMHSDWGYHRNYLEFGARELSSDEAHSLGLPLAEP